MTLQGHRKKAISAIPVASGLRETDEAQQVSTLLYCLGEEAESVLESTNATADERKQYDTVLAKFDSFFKVRRNVILNIYFERARFNSRRQQEGETVEQYIMELYRLADNCNYQGIKEEMIRDRLVVGLRDEALSQQLQMDSGLTLEKAKTKARQREAVGEQQRVLKGASALGDSTSLEEIQSRRRQRGPGPNSSSTKKQPRRKNPAQKEAAKCTQCGKEPHPRARCPARDAECHKCGNRGHYKAFCYSKKLAELTSKDVLETAYLDTVNTGQTKLMPGSLPSN